MAHLPSSACCSHIDDAVRYFSSTLLTHTGGGAVNWIYTDEDNFPPYSGVVPIVLSWFLSPVLTALVAVTIFLACRTLVLRRKHGVAVSFYILPLAVFLTCFINVYFILTKVSDISELSATLLASAILHNHSTGLALI
jgi:phosphate/sulfate permease